jgi:hypothetical protein
MTKPDKESPTKPLRYRVFRSGAGWEWEIRTAEGRIVAHGVGATDVEGRIAAACTAVQAVKAGSAPTDP